MPDEIQDMTIADENVGEPTGQEPMDATPAAENLVPVPEMMAATLKVGDAVTGTVVDQDGALFIQIEPAVPPDAYTGTEQEDMGLNSEDALSKYMKGAKSEPATQ
jgi:hypothetical protein